MSASLTRIADTTATIQRNAIDETGVSAGYTDVETLVPCSKPVPAGGDVATDLTNAPQRLYTCVIVGDYTVRYGDLLVIDGVTYEATAVAPHPSPRNALGQHTTLTIQERLTR
jgi:hypothetical protein